MESSDKINITILLHRYQQLQVINVHWTEKIIPREKIIPQSLYQIPRWTAVLTITEVSCPPPPPSPAQSCSLFSILLAQTPGISVSFAMHYIQNTLKVYFSSLPNFVNPLSLLSQAFLRLSSLYVTLHSEFRNYKVSHHPLKHCY